MCSFLCVSLFKQFSDALIIGQSVTCFCLKSSRIDRSSKFYCGVSKSGNRMWIMQKNSPVFIHLRGRTFCVCTATCCWLKKDTAVPKGLGNASQSSSIFWIFACWALGHCDVYFQWLQVAARGEMLWFYLFCPYIAADSASQILGHCFELETRCHFCPLLKS